MAGRQELSFLLKSLDHSREHLSLAGQEIREDKDEHGHMGSPRLAVLTSRYTTQGITKVATSRSATARLTTR